MHRKLINPPKFKTEAEEADRYSTTKGRELGRREFENALRNGAIIRSSGAIIPRTDPKVLDKFLEQTKPYATQSISIRIPIAEMETAKEIAKRRGIGYQTVLKQAIREGLKTKALLKMEAY